MSGERSNCNQHSNADGRRNANLIDTGPIADLQPHIFKLNAPCFEDIFDWISLKDLKALRETCKQMNEIVNCYIKLKYPKALQRIRMNYGPLEYFRHAKLFNTKIKKFELLNHIEICDGSKDSILSQIDGFKSILSDIESIEVDCPFPEVDFYLVFLKYCPHLKHLMIGRQSIPTLIETENIWLNRYYPALEHFGVRAETKCIGTEIFFGQNRNVKTFTTTLSFIWRNQDWMLKSDIKFDQLYISHDDDSNVKIDHA